MSKENIDTMKKLYEAGARGDAAAFRELVAADTEWTTPPSAELPMWATGTCKGVEAVLKEIIGPTHQLFENFRPEVDEHIDAGDQVISIGRFRGKARNTGKELDSAFVHVSTIKNGKIVRHRNTCDTAAWLRALGLELGKRATLPLKQQAAAPLPH